MWTDTLNTFTSGSPRIQVEPRGSHMEPGLVGWARLECHLTIACFGIGRFLAGLLRMAAA